jgi:predicted nucleic acid-binding protein
MPATLLISDANVLIDMETGGLLRHMFRLAATFAVPNILYEEELREYHPELQKLGLQSRELGEKAVDYAVTLTAAHRNSGASINDLLALALAHQEQCALLSGDGKLREIAIAEKVEVHGTLWLVAQMVNERVITPRQAAAAYAKMKQANRWPPWDEVEKQIRSFRK